MAKSVRRLLVAAACSALAAGAFLLLVYLGAVRFNHPSREKYPVRGVDVSEYQGAIDWPTLAGEGISFAYIKATEGSGYADPRFEANFSGARDAGLRVGAYHFFSFDSPGAAQAANFIAQVSPQPGDLPPAVDLELYGAYKRDPKPADEVWPELQAMLDALEAAYGRKPVLYATAKAHRLYLAGRDVGCDLWIRSVYLAPRVDGWTFWQYTDKAVLEGYEGEEKYIDVNVFRGTAEEFGRYPPTATEP